jgi:mono/diheme cytochrome c family protein
MERKVESKSVPGRPRARRTRFAVATSIFVVLVVAFTVVDITGEAEPSWVETRVASSLLKMKLRFSRSTKASPLAPTEHGLVRGSELYEEQCGFCHGVTRGRMAPFAKSLSPRPPQFVIKPAQGPTWMDAYVIQHGIRWSGMPAFRGLSEADAWRLALYVEGGTQPRER